MWVHGRRVADAEVLVRRAKNRRGGAKQQNNKGYRKNELGRLPRGTGTCPAAAPWLGSVNGK